jgi:7,8-dihydropterin-6-yl-methyl-4-(beta-D-ribofuranosyl)aminobenzene 5'-phosphate synthase
VKNVLFDAGAGPLFSENAEALHLETFGADAVVLSHGHCDHGGGLVTAMREASLASLWLHPGALGEKFSRRDGILHYIGLPAGVKGMMGILEDWGRLEYVKETRKIAENLTLFPCGPKKSLPRDWHFFAETEDGKDVHDRFEDELSLLIEGDNSACVVTGCAHQGIIKICETAKKLTEKPITVIFGGLHIDKSPQEEINALAQYLNELGAEVHTGHCTGINGFCALRAAASVPVHPIHTGLRLELFL